MKKIVIVGVTTKGTRATKTVQVKSSAEVARKPQDFGFVKVSALMSENAYNQSLGFTQ